MPGDWLPVLCKFYLSSTISRPFFDRFWSKLKQKYVIKFETLSFCDTKTTFEMGQSFKIKKK